MRSGFSLHRQQQSKDLIPEVFQLTKSPYSMRRFRRIWLCQIWTWAANANRRRASKGSIPRGPWERRCRLIRTLQATPTCQTRNSSSVTCTSTHTLHLLRSTNLIRGFSKTHFKWLSMKSASLLQTTTLTARTSSPTLGLSTGLAPPTPSLAAILSSRVMVISRRRPIEALQDSQIQAALHPCDQRTSSPPGSKNTSRVW